MGGNITISSLINSIVRVYYGIESRYPHSKKVDIGIRSVHIRESVILTE